MDEPKKEHECPECAARAQKEKDQEEIHFSVLLSLVPLLVITLFNLTGLL
jgi:hypothetical protein